MGGMPAVEEPQLQDLPQKKDLKALDQQLLTAAASGASAADLQAVLDAGADAFVQDGDGRSPLMAAAAGGNCTAIRLLLDTGAPWNAIDKQGRCAGEYATDAGHQEAVDLLLDAGVRAELLLGALERHAGRAEERAASASYLQQRLEYRDGGDGAAVLMDEEDKAVMMAWEGPLMEAHAQVICTGEGDVLNVGFGLGMVDRAIQSRRPRSHTIIEAHPDVLERMHQEGWDKKPGVRIVPGRWQDVLPQLGQFDGIFWDTYSEHYDEQREFHNHLPKLLRKGGLYSYFNGLGADNPFFHAVYCQIVKSELAALGLATQFVPLPINVTDSKVWEGVRNRYWQLDTYFLPVSEWEEEADDS